MSRIYSYAKGAGLIKAMPAGTFNWTSAVIVGNRPAAQVTLKGMTEDEVNALISKLDMICNGLSQPEIADMVAEELPNILMLVQLVKEQTNSPFTGIISGTSDQLDIWPVRPKDVGGTLMNPLATVSLGLYQGTSGGVYSWLTASALTHGTAAHIVPAQTLSQYAGAIFLGSIEKIEVPKIGGIQYTVGGAATSPQPVTSNWKRTFGANDISVSRLEKPVIAGPQKSIAIDVMPTDSGDSNFELIAFLVGRAQDKTL